jgi:flagellar biosynthesis protein FliR
MLAAAQRILSGVGIQTDVSTFVMLFGLAFTRLAAAISLTPFLGGRSASGRIKIGLAAMITVLLYRSIAPPMIAGEISAVRFLCLLIKEAVIGATLGFLTQIVFSAVQMAGAMVDYGRGMSMATFVAPQLETNVSLLGQLQLQAALVLFLILNGHLRFLRALADSYVNVPLMEFPKFAGGTLNGMEQLGHYTAQSLSIAVQLSAPALVALFLVDISFGIIGRVASGVNVHNESQPIKAMVGLGAVLLALAYIINRMPSHFAGMIQQIDELVAHVR